MKAKEPEGFCGFGCVVLGEARVLKIMGRLVSSRLGVLVASMPFKSADLSLRTLSLRTLSLRTLGQKKKTLAHVNTNRKPGLVSFGLCVVEVVPAM